MVSFDITDLVPFGEVAAGEGVAAAGHPGEGDHECVGEVGERVGVHVLVDVVRELGVREDHEVGEVGEGAEEANGRQDPGEHEPAGFGFPRGCGNCCVHFVGCG